MDKVKIALALLKKHHFWVMTCAVILLSFIGWFVATSKLWADYQKGRDKIVKKFTDLTTINSEERENQKWIDGLEKETKQLKTKVRIAWNKVYIEQKDHVLKWPIVLGEKNVKELEKLGPTQTIPVYIRRVYLNYISKEFPQLLKIVDARDMHKDGPGGSADKKGAGEGEDPPHDYKVIWNAQNQKEIYAKLDMSEVPSDRLVRNTQEDLWVYQALLTIISQLNDRATGNYNAKVKEIQSLLIGSDAAAEFQAGMSEGHVEKLEGGAAPAAGAAAAPAAASVVGRYVDEKGVPLPDGGGAAPAAAPDAPPAAGGTAAAEFKRMPVVMKLIMDQREISRLLVECANSPLPVEVRQFRLHKKGGTKPGREPAAGGEKDQSSYDMEVVVEGIIYIFNPPDRAN